MGQNVKVGNFVGNCQVVAIPEVCMKVCNPLI